MGCGAVIASEHYLSITTSITWISLPALHGYHYQHYMDITTGRVGEQHAQRSEETGAGQIANEKWLTTRNSATM
jgi:hypothetical protein